MALWLDEDENPILEKGRLFFLHNLKEELRKNYQSSLTYIDKYDELKNAKQHIKTMYIEKKLVNENESFFQYLITCREEKLYHVSLCMLYLYTNQKISIELYNKYPEYYKLAKIELNNYRRLNENKNTFKVLTIEGGGILGYYQASLLKNLNKNNIHLADSFDLFCGTSTGSILAAALAKKLELEDIKNIYKNNAKNIFPDPEPKNIVLKIFWFISYIFKHTSCQKPLYSKLSDIFKDQTLEELANENNVHLCIPSINAGIQQHTLFKSYDKDTTNKYLVKDVCLASSAAPIYFPLARIKQDNDTKYYVDGGLWANNPVFIGLVEALNLAKTNQKIEIYQLSSIPRSDRNATILSKTKQGFGYWLGGIKIINLSLASQSSGYDYITSKLCKTLKEKYGRDISIYKFNHSQASEKELENFRLDNSSDDNFKQMKAYADTSAHDECDEKIKKLFTI